MKWYAPYISVFGKENQEIAPAIRQEIIEKLKGFRAEEPLVSAVIIAHNEEKHLWSCLWSLSNNKCEFPVEIIGIDNLSTDKTKTIFQESGIRYYSESQKGPGHARQCGLDRARGKYYLCLDADTLYPPRYISTMVHYLQKKNIVAAYSLWSFIPDKDHSPLGLLLYETLRDIHLRLQSLKRPELCVRGMVFGFHTSYGKEIGFRTDIIRGEDGSMAWELTRYGKLKFVTCRKARAVTSTDTLSADGSLTNSLKVRLKKHLRALSSYLSKKKEYKDEKSNLI